MFIFKNYGIFKVIHIIRNTYKLKRKEVKFSEVSYLQNIFSLKIIDESLLI